MKNKITVPTLGAMLLALCSSAQAQQQKQVPRIGYLVTGSASAHSARREAFQKGLRDLGYVEGQNIVIEYRYAEGKIERLPDLAAELVRLKLEVIVASPTESIRAAMNATKTIPIVMGTAGDPVAAGFVVSLAHPGGNVTGSSQMSPELGGKRLELLKESFKKVFVVAVLHTGTATQTVQMKEMELVARALGLQLQLVKIQGQSDLETALSVISKGRATALTGLTSPVFFFNRERIAQFAAKNRLPAIYPAREYVESGGLMSYGPNIAENHRRAATYVDKILKGAKPADLPVEQPTKFEFIISLRAAKQIGVTIPPNVLARADIVIK
jgi:putative tryptophan/tyrosine transport system substrate-binding protein